MNKQLGRRKRHSPIERAHILAEYQQSGLTQKEFAARNGLSMSCLSIWLRKSRTESQDSLQQPAFLRLPMALPARERSGATYKIGFQDGNTVEVFSGFQINELKQICRFLRSL